MEIDFPSSEAILNLFEEVHGHADVNSFRTVSKFRLRIALFRR
jgi:hypothetical protein